MNPTRWANPDLQNLVELFFTTPGDLGEFQETPGDKVPVGYRGLLDHHAHMTVTLEEFHECKMDLTVLNSRDDAKHYSREIQLTRRSDDNVVLYGIVRLNLGLLADDIQKEIGQHEKPLGRILIEHGVLRTVKLLSLWEIQSGPRLNEIFGFSETSTIYGRTALIYCDSVPAIELLEIVAIRPEPN